MTSTTSHRTRARRWITPAVMLVGGTAITLAATFGGYFTMSALIVGLAFTLVATGAFVVLGRTRGDLGAIVASTPDERQRDIDLRATAASGLVMALVLIIGSIVSLAQGKSGQPWVDLGAAYGVTYALCLFLFRRT